MVRRDGKVAMAGDGQVTVGETVMKASARKVRRLYNDKILAGFAGATGDAFSLLTRFEGKLEQYHGNLDRAAIELSKEWRTDKILRHLEALLVVADDKSSFLLSGNGDVISPDDGLLAIGSGGSYALAAARALVANTEMSAREIAGEAMRIAGEICIYSNSNVIVEEYGNEPFGKRSSQPSLISPALRIASVSDHSASVATSAGSPSMICLA